MVTFDSGARIQLGALKLRATGFAYAYAVALEVPVDGSRIPALATQLRFLVSSSTTTHTDVQVQVATSDSFASLFYENTFTDLPDGPATFTLTALAAATTYWWRARAAEVGTTSWSDWTEPSSFAVDLDAGKAFGHVQLDVGLERRLTEPAVHHVENNNGPELPPSKTGLIYVWFNGSLDLETSPAGVAYVELGDVNTGTPAPHIWFLRPTSGRAGDGIQIVGFGFGDLQSTFNGRVEFQEDDGEWVPLPINSWQTFPATPEAYGDDRELDQVLGVIDMQHTVISFTIPPGMVPPGHPLRVVTDGA